AELRARTLAILNQLSNLVHQHLDLAGVTRVALGHTLEVLGMEAGMILLVDAETGYLCVQEHQGLPDAFIRVYLDNPLPPNDPVFGKVASSGKPLILGESGNGHSTGARQTFARQRWNSVVIWPLRVKKQTIGVMAAMSENA